MSDSIYKKEKDCSDVKQKKTKSTFTINRYQKILGIVLATLVLISGIPFPGTILQARAAGKETMSVDGFVKESDAFTYTGEAITQDMQVYYDEILLQEGVDYTLQYKNNVEAGEYNDPDAPRVRIILQGNYSGSQTLYYTIKPCDISLSCSYTDKQTIPYKEKIMLPLPDLTFQGKALAYGKDYICDYGSFPENPLNGDSYEEGKEYTYTVYGQGNYTGSVEIKVQIAKAPNQELLGEDPTPDEENENNADPENAPGTEEPNLSDTDQDVREEGTVWDLAKGSMEVSDRLYSEKEDQWKSPIVIRDEKGVKLIAGVDYDRNVEYTYEGEESFPSVGTTVTVTAYGIGAYEGTCITADYRICSRYLEDLIIRIDDREFTGQEIMLSEEDIHVYAGMLEYCQGQEMTEPAYEIISYRNHINVGKAEVLLRGTGEYGGYKKVAFQIRKKKYRPVLAESITLNKKFLIVGVNTTGELTASVLPENADNKTILWKTSDYRIAKVDKNGLVTGVKPGSAVITAVSQDGNCRQQCEVFVEGRTELLPKGDYRIPQDFVETKDKDDTMSFIRAIRSLDEECNTLYVPVGTYRINATVRIQVEKSDINIIMSDGAVLEAIGNSNTHSDVFEVKNVNNVTITGGIIKGERYQHSGSKGEWGMGIGIYDSHNITVDGVSISQCFGDGIYIGSDRPKDADAGCTDIKILNCHLFNNRRNNLSIVYGSNVTVDKCRFEYANGTAPEYGIDIETNDSSKPCKHIQILNSSFQGNGGAAMGIVTATDDILVKDCVLNGDFINYAGTNVVLSGCKVNGELDARIGISMIDGTVVNSGSEKEDSIVADFTVTEDSYSFGKYQVDEDNPMSASVEEDESSVSGKKITLKRTEDGTKEAGFYLDLKELTEGKMNVLKANTFYRFEYSIKGTGQWGFRTDQTGWYPIAPESDQYATGAVEYKADSSSVCRLFFYALDYAKDTVLDIEWIKIYEVK